MSEREKQIEEAAGRFWLRVIKTPECWNWTGTKTYKGYGRIQVGGKAYFAHRLSILLAGKRLGAALVVDHKCRNKLCVNPGHFRQVSPGVNTLENNDSFSAVNARKTHCVRGHEFNEENTKFYKMGERSSGDRRQCKICRRDAKRRRKKNVRK